ncbi:hypothetical protein CDAR_294651 [Caerostris darwini]|uniref:Uncharacterized protein n=1 Tax=Caerostris darwini TaxID=1538125 RepID=A0AAV4UKP8_9ARAC|nr:hypothetical protein CDAR_294651 [Caerostris darwini]
MRGKKLVLFRNYEMRNILGENRYFEKWHAPLRWHTGNAATRTHWNRAWRHSSRKAMSGRVGEEDASHRLSLPEGYFKEKQVKNLRVSILVSRSYFSLLSVYR